MKLNVKVFLLSCGLIFGISLFMLTWWAIITIGSVGQSTIIGVVYPGYNLSPIGSLIGFAWAFVTGGILGGIFALIYNGLLSFVSEE